MKKLEKLIKKIFLAFFSLVLPLPLNSGSKDDWKYFTRILIFRLDNRLGNSILILSLVRAIKSSLPNCSVDILMTFKFNEVYKDHPDIREIIPYNQAYLFRNPFRFIKLIRKLRINRYQAVFSSSNPNSLSVSQAIFARMITSGKSIGFDDKEGRHIYSDPVKGSTKLHYANAQVDLWRYFDPMVQFHWPKVYFLKNQKQKKQEAVLFWLGATGKKILGPDIIKVLLTIFAETNVKVRLAAGIGDNEMIQKYPPRIRQSTEILEGSLLESAIFFKQFKVICTPDTGPMHLMAALGIPIIQIFVNSNIVWYGYYGEDQFIIDKSINIKDLTTFLKHYFTDS